MCFIGALTMTKMPGTIEDRNGYFMVLQWTEVYEGGSETIILQEFVCTLLRTMLQVKHIHHGISNTLPLTHLRPLPYHTAICQTSSTSS